MPLRITLSNQDAVEAAISLNEWNDAYYVANKSGTMIEIREPSGRIVSINPQQVLFVEEPARQPAAPPREIARA
jgi:hypothetical protein